MGMWERVIAQQLLLFRVRLEDPRSTVFAYVTAECSSNPSRHLANGRTGPLVDDKGDQAEG